MVEHRSRVARSPAALAQKLFKLERCGRYEDALEEASYIWPDHTLQPDLSEFPAQLAAELRLRLGALIGFHGHLAQINGLQDTARDLLAVARREFEELGLIEKMAECDNYSALTYWRKGEIEEANIVLTGALGARLPRSSTTWLYSCIIRCLIGMPNRTHTDNLALLDMIEEDVWRHGDDCMKGDLFSHRSTAYDNTDQPELALKNFELAMHFFRRAKHWSYLGLVENNLAWFFKKHGDFERAHRAADSGIKTQQLAKDKTREGFTYDTKAALYLAEGKLVEAMQAVDKALDILSKGENVQYRVDTYFTKCSILLEMGDFSEAVVVLMDAVDQARSGIGEKAARRLIDDFEKVYMAARQRDKKVPKRESFDKLSLLLPADISHYDDYRGLRVTNDHLSAFGLERGSLAIVACCEVSRGDLAVVCRKDNDEVSCGIYDEFAGIVSLEDPAGGDPRLFDQDQITILGKIVGRGDESVAGRDRIPVEPLAG